MDFMYPLPNGFCQPDIFILQYILNILEVEIRKLV